MIGIVDIHAGAAKRWTPSEQIDGTCLHAFLVRQGRMILPPVTGTAQIHAGHWLITSHLRQPPAFSEDAEILALSFHAALSTGESLFQVPQPRVLHADRHPKLEMAAVALVAQITERLSGANSPVPPQRPNPSAFIALHKHLLDWLAVLVDAMALEGILPERPEATNPRLRRALDLLDRWPVDRPLDRKRLACEAGLTIQHLDRLFLAALGVTPCRYLEQRRIRCACESLCASATSIKAIGYELGFHSEAHFSHWFKRRKQMSPRRFRESHAPRART